MFKFLWTPCKLFFWWTLRIVMTQNTRFSRQVSFTCNFNIFFCFNTSVSNNKKFTFLIFKFKIGTIIELK